MRDILIEVCCESVEDCIKAYEAGIKRVELNSSLHLGGLTPTVGNLISVKKYCGDLSVMTMIRPRGAGFCYSEAEYEVMLLDAKLLLEKGSDGLVFGFLNPDRIINRERTGEFANLAHSYGKEAVFHRAFDCVPSQEKAIKELIELGINRVLTSGGAETALKGWDKLKLLNDSYGKDIEILPGCGINPENALEIVEKTGISQIHGSFSKNLTDPTTFGEKVSFGYDPANPRGYKGVSEDKLKVLINNIKGEKQ